METITRLLFEYGVIVVFANVLLEQAGIPLPTLPVLVLSGALASSGGASMPAVLLASLLATMIADTGWYLVGMYRGQKVLSIFCKASRSQDACKSGAEATFARLGGKALLFAKYLPGIGPVATALSGVAHIPLRRFLVLDLTGALLYFVPAVFLGQVFHDAIGAFLDWASRLGLYAILIVLMTAAVWLVSRHHRNDHADARRD